MKRAAKDFAKRSMFHAHLLLSRLGVHVLPAHYYSPVHDVNELRRTRASWARKSELPGIEHDLDAQVAELAAVCGPWKHEYAGNAFFKEAAQKNLGPGYGFIEAQTLYAVIRQMKPARVIEVGSGVSTYCMVAAAGKNAAAGAPTTGITCVEPYPSRALRDLGEVSLRECCAQEVEFAFFEQLDAGDLLFIDSSHAVKPGSDVNFLILEVLPRLKPGVLIHFHDINLPYDYSRDTLKSFYHWAETSLLRAFLTFNSKFRILFSLSQLHYDRQAELRALFPEYDPEPDADGLRLDSRGAFAPTDKHFPSSIYLRRVA